MTNTLLNLPPELLINILSLLPIQSLLRFSESNQYCHSLAKTSLHSLSLAVHTTRVSSIISYLATTRYPNPKLAVSCFSSHNRERAGSDEARKAPRSVLEEWSTTNSQPEDDDPYKVSVVIPDAHDFNFATLLSFHTALTRSILLRHGATLRHLELTCWTLTIPVAKALASLPALRALSVRNDDFPHARAVPRKQAVKQRDEERQAWSILSSTAVWASRLRALRIEGGEISSAHLFTLLGRSGAVRELWLYKCSFIGKELWAFLGRNWHGRAALRVLGLSRCGGQLGEEALLSIGALDLQVSKPLCATDSLGRSTRAFPCGVLRCLSANMSPRQFLSLRDCNVLKGRGVETWNQDVWHIPECVLPARPSTTGDTDSMTVIEVDPLYLQEGEVA